MENFFKPCTVKKAEYFSEKEVDDPQEEMCSTSSDLHKSINIFLNLNKIKLINIFYSI